MKQQHTCTGWLRTLAALALLLALAGWTGYAQAAEAVGTFSIEQVYVNVPEMDVFVYALDGNDEPISPMAVQAAGVEVTLGDEIITPGNILMSNEPICYIFVLDNTVDAGTLSQFRLGIRQMIAAKQERDQIALYTTAGGVECALSATSNRTAALSALAGIESREDKSNFADAATRIYRDIGDNYQSIAPRKVIVACTDVVRMMSDMTLLGGMMTNAASQLNMAVYTFVASQNADRFAFLEELSDAALYTCDVEEIPDEMLAMQQYLGKALELKTVIGNDRYGERLETLTVSVPSMGSAIKSSTNVYMGYRLTKPAVEAVEVLDRTHLRLVFNQSIAGGNTARSYRLETEDIWNWHPAIRAVELSQDGRSATLTTEPLYAGNYTVGLKRVASSLSAANTSDSRDSFDFQIAVWPRDRGFYFGRFLGPALLLALALGGLAGAMFWQKRREQQLEQQAEAENLLQNASGVRQLPRRWLTLLVRTRRAVAESRWSAQVESSILIGSDPDLCDLCVEDSRVAAQHCMIGLEGDHLLVRALGDQVVRVNEERIGDAHRLQNNDVIKIGRSTLRVVL